MIVLEITENISAGESGRFGAIQRLPWLAGQALLAICFGLQSLPGLGMAATGTVWLCLDG
jgi:hypothetical protein